jgi:hypothetical protein
MTEPTDTPQDAIAAPSLVEGGAAPVEVDVAAMMAQIQALQARVDSMSVAAGIPSDPVAAAVKDLKDHIAGRARSVPTMAEALSPLTTEADALEDKPTADQVDFLRSLFDEVPAFEGKEYCKQLATKAYKLVKV